MTDTSNKCYNHPQTAAIASCPICGRHFCEQCAHSLGSSLYCSSECAQLVKSKYDSLNTERKKLDKMDKRVTAVILLFPILWTIIGGVLTFILFQDDWNPWTKGAWLILVPIGIVLLSMLIIHLKIRARETEIFKQIDEIVGGVVNTKTDTPTKQLGKTSELPTQEVVPLSNSKKYAKKAPSGGGTEFLIAVFIGFIAMSLLNFIPVLGPILAGFIAGVIAGGGAGRGLSAGFLSGIIGAVVVAILVTTGFGFFGNLFDLPLIGPLLGGAIGLVIVIMSLYNGLLGLVGGAIGGAIRKR